MAAPIGAQIFGEVLPYLEIAKDNESQIEQITTVEVPNVIGLSINEANKILKDSGLVMQMEETEGLDKENTIIKSQTPNSKITVNNGSTIYLEY